MDTTGHSDPASFQGDGICMYMLNPADGCVKVGLWREVSLQLISDLWPGDNRLHRQFYFLYDQTRGKKGDRE